MSPPAFFSFLPHSKCGTLVWPGVCELETSKQIMCRAPDLGHTLEEPCPCGSGVWAQLHRVVSRNLGPQCGLVQTGAQSALSGPRLLPVSPLSPLCCPVFISLFLPASQVAPRWREFHSGSQREVIHGKSAKAALLGYLAWLPATCPAQLMLSWAGHAPAGICWGPALHGVRTQWWTIQTGPWTPGCGSSGAETG